SHLPHYRHPSHLDPHSFPTRRSSDLGLTISTNSEGLPLNGITIRAAAGQTPTLDGTGLGDQADIMIVGLQNVLLQGLKITGGSRSEEHTSELSHRTISYAVFCLKKKK